MKRFSWREHKVALIATGFTVVGLFLTGAAVLLLSEKPVPIVINVEPQEYDEITSFGAARTVYAHDGTTVLEKHTPYADGGLGHVFNRPDGTLKETAEHYPLRAGASTPVLKSKSTWSEDGKSIVSGEVYRPDGTLWFTYKNLGNNRRQDTFYFRDGWKFSQSEYNPADPTKETSYFHRSGNLWAKEVGEKSYGTYFNEKSMILYDDSTPTRMVTKTEAVGWNQTVDGFSAGSNSGKLVSYYDADSKRIYRQFYTSGWNWYLQAQGTLKVVDVYDQWGNVKKTYEVEDSQDTVKLKTSSKPDGSFKVFRDFGANIRKISIEKVDVQGQPKERFLQLGTCVTEQDGSGVQTEHADSDRVYDIFDLVYFAQPKEQELRLKKTESQAESRGVLGTRDDTDPVKWYHKQ